MRSGPSEDEAMRVAVVTSYFTEPRAMLEQNVRSVQTQGHPECAHVLVADWYPRAWLDNAGPLHLKLPVNTGDFGDTPRAVGIAFASSVGYEAITPLDADCYLMPGAIDAYVSTARRERVPLVIGKRTFARADGTRLQATDEPVEHHVDTNCYFFTRAGFGVLMKWANVPPMFHVMGDRLMHLAVTAAAFPYAEVTEATVTYRTSYAAHYRSAGEPPPAYAKSLAPAVNRAGREWQALDPQTRAAYCAALGFGFRMTDAGLQLCAVTDA
jgi:hypothetical protein